MVSVLQPYSFQLPNIKPDVFVQEKYSLLLFFLLVNFDFKKLLVLAIVLSIQATFLTFISRPPFFCNMNHMHMQG